MKKFYIILSLLIVGVYLSWSIAFPRYSFRYKVTVNVETPEGMRTGYAVREFEVHQQPPIAGSGPSNFARGEAVVVDLGARGLLFAVISLDDEWLVFKTFPKSGALTPAGMRYYEQLDAKATLEPLKYPLLIGFKDINDPKSITLAYGPIYKKDLKNPAMQKLEKIENNMTSLFGPGVRVESVTLEMTKEPVTWTIDNKVHWLQEHKKKGGTFSGQTMFRSPPSPEKVITADNFQLGNK